jgi:heme exporter protein D
MKVLPAVMGIVTSVQEHKAVLTKAIKKEERKK